MLPLKLELRVSGIIPRDGLPMRRFSLKLKLLGRDSSSFCNRSAPGKFLRSSFWMPFPKGLELRAASRTSVPEGGDSKERTPWKLSPEEFRGRSLSSRVFEVSSDAILIKL